MVEIPRPSHKTTVHMCVSGKRVWMWEIELAVCVSHQNDRCASSWPKSESTTQIQSGWIETVLCPGLLEVVFIVLL